MRHRLLLLAALVVLLIAIYVYKKRLDAIEAISNAQVRSAVSTDTSTVSEVESSEGQKAMEVAADKKMQPSMQDKLNNLNLKNIEQIRDEAKNNPHRTPPTVIRTALEIGSAYDAVKNQEEARQFIDKMKSCSHKDEETYLPIKAACLNYARKITARYPQLESDYKDLVASASPEALKIESQNQRRAE